jgi:hypothetical protein
MYVPSGIHTKVKKVPVRARRRETCSAGQATASASSAEAQECAGPADHRDQPRTYARAWWKASQPRTHGGRPQQLSFLLTTCWLLLLVA